MRTILCIQPLKILSNSGSTDFRVFFFSTRRPKRCSASWQSFPSPNIWDARTRPKALGPSVDRKSKRFCTLNSIASPLSEVLWKTALLDVGKAAERLKTSRSSFCNILFCFTNFLITFSLVSVICLKYSSTFSFSLSIFFSHWQLRALKIYKNNSVVPRICRCERNICPNTCGVISEAKIESPISIGVDRTGATGLIFTTCWEEGFAWMDFSPKTTLGFFWVFKDNDFVRFKALVETSGDWATGWVEGSWTCHSCSKFSLSASGSVTVLQKSKCHSYIVFHFTSCPANNFISFDQNNSNSKPTRLDSSHLNFRRFLSPFPPLALLFASLSLSRRCTQVTCCKYPVCFSPSPCPHFWDPAWLELRNQLAREYCCTPWLQELGPLWYKIPIVFGWPVWGDRNPHHSTENVRGILYQAKAFLETLEKRYCWETPSWAQNIVGQLVAWAEPTAITDLKLDWLFLPESLSNRPLWEKNLKTTQKTNTNISWTTKINWTSHTNGETSHTNAKPFYPSKPSRFITSNTGQ